MVYNYRQPSKAELHEEAQPPQLNYDKVKQDLQEAEDRRKCLLLQALRWVSWINVLTVIILQCCTNKWFA
mgnify:CR=1 FL=1